MFKICPKLLENETSEFSVKVRSRVHTNVKMERFLRMSYMMSK